MLLSKTISAAIFLVTLVTASASKEDGNAKIVSKECVVIHGRNTNLSKGWVADHSDGVTFMPDNMSKLSEKAGAYPIYYKFKAPSSSRYAVVLDMTTRGRALYNDVFMSLSPGGFQLIRDDVPRFSNGWIKGYHSNFARAAIVSSVDFMPHSISSGVILEKGKEYVFGVSGRSNRVTLHNVILFACEGLKCQRKHWRSDLEACLPGSTAYTPRPRPIKS